MVIWLHIALVNWCAPFALGLLLVALANARGDVITARGLHLLVEVRSWPEKQLEDDWGAFTFSTVSFFWDPHADREHLIAHERGHVILWLIFGLAGGIVYMLILAAMRPFQPSWYAAYRAHPYERWCERYADRRVPKPR